MKLLILLLTLTIATAREAPVTVSWNPNPEPNITYRVYRGLDLLAATAATQITVYLPTDQQSTLHVTAVNTDGLASLPSQRLVLTPVNVQTSADLRVWAVVPSSTFFHTLERDGVVVDKHFFRFEYYPSIPCIPLPTP